MPRRQGKVQWQVPPTTGETFHYHNEPEPLTELGRVPGSEGAHVLRRADGSLVIHGGYHLRRPGEVWEDFLSQD